MSTPPAAIDVLHVDDDPDVRELVATYLERVEERVSVTTARSPDEALDYLASGTVDCIVSDYEMPDTDGIEFLRAVRERDPEVPFVLYTGEGSEAIAIDAISAGATEYLRKGSGSENYELLANRIVNAVEKTRSVGRASRYKRVAELVRTIQSALVQATAAGEIDAAVCETLAEADPYHFVRIWDVHEETGRFQPRASAGRTDGGWDSDANDHERGERELIDAAIETASIEVTRIGAEDVGHTDEADDGELTGEADDGGLTGGVDDTELIGTTDDAGDVRSIAAVPLVYDADTYGVVTLYADRTNAFGADERELLDELGETIAHALERVALQREYEEQYHQLFENAPVMFAFTREEAGELHVEECNEQLAETLGYAREELRGRPVADLYTEESQWQMDEGGGSDRVLSGELVADERELVTADGERISTVLRAAPRRNEDGEIVGTNSLYVDVTHRERIEAVSQRRRQLRQVLDLIPDFVFAKDADGRFFLVNEALAEAFATTPQEMVGKTDFDLLDDEAARQFRVDDREVIERNAPKYIPHEELTDADGNTHILETRKIPFTIAGTDTDAVLSYARDVTDLRERERVLQEVNRLISDRERAFEEKVGRLLEIGLDALDLDYGIFATADASDYTVSVARSPEGRIDGGDTVPRSTTVCDHVMRSGESLVAGNLAVEAPAVAERASEPVEGVSAYLGTPVSVAEADAGVVCLFSTDPRPDGFSQWETTLLDLFGQWLSYESNREVLTEDLARKNERLERFATIVSHDLRNPLNVADGRLKLARDEVESEHLDEVARAHERMAEIIEGVLTLAQDGAESPDLEPIALPDVVADCWSNVETGDASLTVDAERTVPAAPNSLRQLFENLFRNAVEHAGVDVAVTVGDLPDGFYVADDGPGIPEPERDDVFETGYTTGSENGGFGLGIVREVARAHDWTVDVVAGEAGGARFEFTGVQAD